MFYGEAWGFEKVCGTWASGFLFLIAMIPELVTKRFLLQEILPEDQSFIFEGLSHPQVISFYGVHYKTFEETSAQMQFYSQLQKEGAGLWWKLVEAWTFEKVGQSASTITTRNTANAK